MTASQDSTPPALHVCLISDQTALHTALRHVLSVSQAPFELIACFNNLRAASAYLRNHPAPDVFLLDLHTDPLSVVQWLRRRAPSGLRFLLTSRLRDEAFEDRALLAGARGHLAHDAPLSEWGQALQAVAMGDVWLNPATSARLIKRMFQPEMASSGTQTDAAQASPANLRTGAVQAANSAGRLSDAPPLTQRERSIVQTLLAFPAEPAKRIAQRLNISESTLRNHLTTIYDKLGVKNRMALVSQAYQVQPAVFPAAR